MNEEEFAPDSEKNLESLLLSLQSNQNSESANFTAANRFRFCHDIITLSKIPNFLINLISFLIFIIYDFTICLQAIPFHWFESLSPNQFLEDPTSLNFIFSELLVQQISFAMILVILLFVIFQWISLFLYDPNLHLSRIKASILYFSFNYLPFILSPIIGTFFGSLVLATSGDSTQNTSIFYALILPIAYLFLLLNYSIFNSTCEYNLIIGKALFSFFSPPFHTVDAMVMFFIAFFTAFILDHQKSILTISAAVSLIWGVSVFFIKRQNAYVSYFSNVCFRKLPIDAIVFGFLTIINIWFSIPYQFLFDLWVTLMLFDFGASVLIMRFYYLTTKIVFEHVSGCNFNPAKINKSIDALNFLRYGIMFKFSEAVDRDFLSWSLTHFCSEALIVDTVRICLALNIPLNEMPLQRFSLAPHHLTSMKFISFQLDQFRKFQSDDSSPLVKIAITELQREGESLKSMSDSDVEHHSITWLGKETRRSKKLFQNFASEFQNSKMIDQLWINFCDNILFAPSKAVSPPPNAFELLPKPFSYVIKDKEQIVPPRRIIKPSSIERLTQQFANSATWSFRFWVRLTLIAFICFVISDNICYTQSMRQFAQIFSDISQLFIYGSALSYKFLKNIDSLSVLPGVNEIMSIIGINSNIANEFKSNFVLNSEEINSGKKYLNLFSSSIPSFNRTNCESMSLLLATDFEQPTTSTIEQHRCYTNMMEYYIDSVANYTNDQVDEVYKKLQVRMTDDYLALIVVFSFLTIFYIWIFVTIKKKQIKALRIIKKINTKKYEFREPGFSFSVILSIFLWLIILAVAFALFYVYFNEVKSNSSLMRDCLFQMDMVSDIARNAMAGLALIEFSILDKNNHRTFERSARRRGRLVLKSTQLLTVNGVNDSFLNVEPLVHWSTPRSDSFSVLLLDFGHMMMNGNFSVNSYNFLMLRYLIIFNISQLANETLENMMAAALFDLQGNGSSFWLASIVFLLFALITWLLLECLHLRHRLWFNGVRFIFRRELSSSPKRMRRMLKLINKEYGNILEKLPFPALICTVKNNGSLDEIVDSNEDAAFYMKLSIDQIRGQKFSEFFEDENEVKTDENRTLRFSKTSFSKNLMLVRIEDTTSILKKQESRQKFISKMRPDFEQNLPICAKMIIISFKFLAKPEACDQIEPIIRSIEEKYPDVKRITIGFTFYRAVVLVKNDIEEIQSNLIVSLKFVEEIIERLGNVACGAMTWGEVIITPLVESEVVSVVCGEAVDRCENFLLCGEFGKCAVDNDILIGSQIDSPFFVSMK